MKKNYFSRLILPFIFLFCLQNFSQEVTFTETEINFGSVDTGSHKNTNDLGVELNFSFANPSNPSEEYKISNIYFRGDNASDFSQNNNFYSGFGLRNEDQYHFIITFSPQTSGNKVAELVFEYEDSEGNAATNSPAVIELTGSSEVPLIPVLEEVVFVDFGTNDIFTTTTKNVTLENSGNKTLVISDISILSNGDGDQFSLEDLSFPLEIDPFTTFNFDLTFSPTANFTNGIGNRHALVKITSNHNNETDNEQIISLYSNILTPDFSITTKDYNFGDVFIDQNNTTSVTLENNGNGTLVLDRFEFSETGNFTVEGTAFPLNISPNSTKDVTVKFNPTTVGQKDALLAFYAFNDGSTPLSTFVKKSIYVTLSGKGIDKTLNEPENITFNNTRIGQEDTASFTLHVTNGAPVNISDITITGDDATSFSITSSTSKDIAVGENFTVDLSFSPTKVGNHNAIVTVLSDASNNPVSLNINGNGITSELTVSPTSILFDDTIIQDTSDAKNITLSNLNGTDAVSISAINITGENADEFKIEGTVTFPIQIDAGATKNIETFFSPLTPGNKTAIIEIISNDVNSPQIINISGNTLTPVATILEKIISFDKTAINTTPRIQFISIKNDGNTDLTLNNITLNGDNATDFQLEPLSFPLTITANTNKIIAVNFSPTNTGNRIATATLDFDIIDNDALVLSGIGIAPVADISNIDSFGELAITENNSEKTISITNSGTSDLIITDINKTGTNENLFVIDEISLPLILKEEESITLKVNFTIPTNTTDIGNKSAIISFTSNDTKKPIIERDLSANVVSLPNFHIEAEQPIQLPSVNAGDVSFSKIKIENTGTEDLVLKGGIYYPESTGISGGLGIQRNNVLPQPYRDQGYNKFPITIPAGNSEDILVSYVGFDNGSLYKKIMFTTNKTISGEYLVGQAGIGIIESHVNYLELTAGVTAPELEVISDTPVVMFDTSLGRSSKKTFTIKNTGTENLAIVNFENDAANGFSINTEAPFYNLIPPNKERTIEVIFNAKGNLGVKNGSIKLVSNIQPSPTVAFTEHIIQITGTATEPKEVTANGMTFKGDRISIDGDVTTLSGNVHADNLEFDSDVTVNTVSNVVTTNGQVFVLDIKEQGGLGGEKVLLAEGELEFKIDKDVQKVANLSLLAGSKITNKAFSLVGIPVSITKIKLIDDGIQVGGKLTLPPEVFGEDSHITIETIEVSKSNGINVKGSAAINPELKVLKILSVNSAKVTFDTFTNSFSAEGEIELRLVSQKVTIAGKLAIINGGLDTVSLEVETNPGVPLANSGLALAGGNGFIKNIQNPPISLGLGVDIIPVAPPVETIRFDNMQIAYTFGTSFEASGNVDLFGERLGSASLALFLDTTNDIYGVKVAASVNAYNILKGSADLSVLSKQSKLYIEGNSELSVTIPKLELGCFVCGAIDKFLPYKIATAKTYFNNTKISASVNIAKVLDVYVKIESSNNGYKTNFGGNFKPLNISFKNGLTAKGLNANNLIFENNQKLKDKDHLEGQSLIVNANKSPRFKGGSGTTEIPFSLDSNYKTIILRVQGTSSTPNYVVEFPDKSEVTPENAVNLGHFQNNYDEKKQNYYILNNVIAGDYVFKINGTDTYQADIAGAEFAPNLTVNSINYAPTKDELEINWTDADVDSDAKISLYYATDKKGNGTEIISDISENDTTDSYRFDTSSLRNGTYYIYGKIDDGDNIPEISFATETFTVNKASKVEVPTLTSNVFNNTIQLSWSPVEAADHYLVYIDDKLVNNLSSNENVGSETFYDIVNLSPGKTYHFAVTAVKTDFTESNLSNIETINFVSSTINNIPVILTESLPEKNDSCGLYTTEISASDMDTEDELTYRLITAPEGMILNNNQIEWRPNNTHFGRQEVIVEVDDNKGGVVSKSYEIVVNKIDEEAPILATESLPEIISECSFTVIDTPSANDKCSGTVTGVANKTTFSELGKHTIVWTFDDGNGNTITQNQTVIIKDTKQPIILAKDISIELGKTGSKTISINDIDEGSTDNCGIFTRVLSKKTFTNTNIGENIIKYTVTDYSGNTSTKYITITVTNATLSSDDHLSLNKSVTLYPNPTNGIIKLNYNINSIKINQVDIFDITGKKVNNNNIPLKNNEINVRQLASGIYLLRIVSDKGILTKRFSKQ